MCLYFYYGFTALSWALAVFFSFLIYTQSVGLLGRGISRSQGLYLHTEQHKQNKRTQTSMPLVGFEITIAVFERMCLYTKVLFSLWLCMGVKLGL
jgi:hypothetical protein